MSVRAQVFVEEIDLRRAAFSIEQMAPGGIDRPDPGQLRPDDIGRAFQRIDDLLARPGGRDEARRSALIEVRKRTERLLARQREAGGSPIVYVERPVFALEPRLRSPALEIDFTFGDRDGRLSVRDLERARFHYGQVRGPVGWNRLLITDELERRLFPERTLSSTDGLRLRPGDWLAEPPDRTGRLHKVSRYLDDAALARTYADVAARLACAAAGSSDAALYERALCVLGQQIKDRGSVRPTITDIARIGCDDPEIKSRLRTPIEMSRRLSPSALLDRFLGAPRAEAQGA